MNPLFVTFEVSKSKRLPISGKTFQVLIKLQHPHCNHHFVEACSGFLFTSKLSLSFRAHTRQSIPCPTMPFKHGTLPWARHGWKMCTSGAVQLFMCVRKHGNTTFTCPKANVTIPLCIHLTTWKIVFCRAWHYLCPHAQGSVFWKKSQHQSVCFGASNAFARQHSSSHINNCQV